MERISGETNFGTEGSTIESHMEMSAGSVETDFDPSLDATGGTGTTSRMDQAKDRARHMAGQAQERLGEVRERATDVLDQAGTRLEDSGALEIVRNNPLPALGIAFGVGFVLAGSSDTGGRMGKAKQNVKGAVLGSLSAAVSQQVKQLIDSQGGAQGLMNSLMGSQRGSEGSTNTQF